MCASAPLFRDVQDCSGAFSAGAHAARRGCVMPEGDVLVGCLLLDSMRVGIVDVIAGVVGGWVSVMSCLSGGWMDVLECWETRA